jgi:hypothetical protein
MEINSLLQSLFYPFFRVPNKGVLLPVSLRRSPIGRDASPPDTLSVISQIHL